LPNELVLGDPATRDAAIHAVQACIPQATILPIGVDRLIPGVVQGSGGHFAKAEQRSEAGDLLVFDIDITDEEGLVRERWEGLRLRVVEQQEPGDNWPEPLLGPYLERRMREMLPDLRLTVEVERNGGAGRRTRSDRLFHNMLGNSVAIARRPDGKPEVNASRAVSAAHAGDWTIAVSGPGPIACDLEPVMARPDSLWRDLLGLDRWELAGLIAQDTGEPLTQAATRAWVASECLIKAGVVATAPLVLRTSAASPTVILGSGSFVIATFLLTNFFERQPLVLGLLVRDDDARL
jgi:enediyne polyketide synthase